MHVRTLLLTLALLVAPVAVADQGSDTVDDACHEADDRDACEQRYCESHPEECRADGDPQNGTQAPRDPPARPGEPPEAPDHPRNGTPNATMERPRPPCEGCDRDVQGRYVTFDADLRNASLYDLRVDGRPVLDAVRVDGAVKEVEKEGGSLRVSGEDWRLRLQDAPTANIQFKDHNVSIRFDAPDGLVWRHTGDAWHFDGDVRGVLVGDHVRIEGDVAIAEGSVTFHVQAPPAQDRPQHEEKIERAAEQRHIGAEVQIRSAKKAAEDQTSEVEVLHYDDVELTVESAAATEADPLRVVVSADLSEGRTIVLDVDPSLLTGTDLVLRYYDVNDDGTETEVVFQQASSLADVLDPTDDAGAPEYWVVEDADGVQVLVSVPHWSTHVVSLASIGEVAPSVLIGLGAGAAGVGVAALLLLRPRRR